MCAKPAGPRSAVGNAAVSASDAESPAPSGGKRCTFTNATPRTVCYGTSCLLTRRDGLCPQSGGGRPILRRPPFPATALRSHARSRLRGAPAGRSADCPVPLALDSPARAGKRITSQPQVPSMEAFASKASNWSHLKLGLQPTSRMKGLWYDVDACRERTIREGSERVAPGNVLRNSLITEDWVPCGAPVLFLSLGVPEVLCREGG